MAPGLTRYLVSIGSNIAPRRHIPRIVLALLDLAPTLHLSRIVETAPVGLVGEPFYNLVVALDIPGDPATLKEQFNALESALGRDRCDPERALKSRPADLDILFHLSPDARRVPDTWLPQEPYIRPMLLELLLYLGFQPTWDNLVVPPGLSLNLNGALVGLEAVTVMKRRGQLRLERLSF